MRGIGRDGIRVEPHHEVCEVEHYLGLLGIQWLRHEHWLRLDRFARGVDVGEGSDAILTRGDARCQARTYAIRTGATLGAGTGAGTSRAIIDCRVARSSAC